MTDPDPTPVHLPPCDRCGHPADWHRHDEADAHDITDPACPFRCIGYDCEATGPPPAADACDCPDYRAP